MVDVADERMKTVILLLASTGMRVGALNNLYEEFAKARRLSAL
jgi:hypothetical protein